MAKPVTEQSLKGALFARFEKSQRSQQGMAIWGDYAFLLYHGGHCDVMDLRTRKVAAAFHPESYTGDAQEPLTNHANMAVFRHDPQQQGAFPLLYITAGNAGGMDENGYCGHCAVEQIQMRQTPNGPVFTSQVVQRIYFNDSTFKKQEGRRYEGLAYEGVCWGWPAFFPDAERDRLYLFSSRFRTDGSFRHLDAENAYIVTSFRLPNPSNPKAVLTPKDIMDQFAVEYDVEITQGGTLYDNKIIYTFGFGREGYPNKLRVIDLDKREIVKKVDLSKSIFRTEEIEAVDIYKGKLLCNTNSGGIFLLGDIADFAGSHPLKNVKEDAPAAKAEWSGV